MPASTSTPDPTGTPTATSTSTPTQTPSPTPTIEPPAQLVSSLIDAKLTFYDSFDTLSKDDWKLAYCQTLNAGEIVYACQGNNSMSRNTIFHDGEGILVDFMKPEPTNDYKMGIHLYNSNLMDQHGWQEFGITDGPNQGTHLSILKGNSAYADFNINQLKANTWYRLVLAIDANGRILLMTWERDNPEAQPWKYRNTIGKDWTGGKWIFWVHNQEAVTWHFDNFYQIAFSSIK
jgi:hypothetical protein